MTAEGTFPKSSGDILHASEVNTFNTLLTSKTSYWTCAGNNFVPTSPETDAISKSYTAGDVEADVNDLNFSAPVSLPHGAVITGVIVYGNAGAAAESWAIRRATLSDASTDTLALANINTEDTTISNATVDNNTYYYFLKCSLDDNDVVYGARITYTTNYI